MLVASASLAGPSALADAPPDRYVVTADTVRDTKTSLLWQRAVSLVDGGNVQSLEQATRLCSMPWRLPTIKELATLVDEDAAAPPFIDAKAFPATPNLPVWSSTHSNALMEDYRSYVLSSDGTMMSVYYNGSDLPGGGVVRCVQ